MQRKEATRNGRSAAPRAPNYPTYTPPARNTVTDTYDSYEAERNKASKPIAPKGKGMQLGKKSKTTDMFERVRGDMGAEVEEAPLVAHLAGTTIADNSPTPTSATHDANAVHVTISETIAAKISREGTMSSMEIKGDLQLRISDPAYTKVRLQLGRDLGTASLAVKTHPKVDKNVYNSEQTIQMADTTKGFPVNNSVGVLRWREAYKDSDLVELPISFNVWINKGDDETYAITVEYECRGSQNDEYKDVTVTIPYASSEPVVSSFDATYEVSGDSLEWTIGTISANGDTATGSFEFEATADSEDEFFPMQIRFSKTEPWINIDVSIFEL